METPGVLRVVNLIPALTKLRRSVGCCSMINRRAMQNAGIRLTRASGRPNSHWFHALLLERELPTETKVESATSQSKSGTSVDSSNSGRFFPTERHTEGAVTTCRVHTTCLVTERGHKAMCERKHSIDGVACTVGASSFSMHICG